MPLISDQIPNLLNGVSQQAVALRLKSQAEAQVNYMSSVSDGLTKRLPSEHIAKLSGTPETNAFTHLINRDTTERYKVYAKNGSLQVFDLNGNEKTVAFPDGTAYLNTADPRGDLRAVTVADYTFVLNRSVTASKRTTTTAVNQSSALLFVKAVNYEVTYKVEVDGVQKASYTTDASTAAAPTLSVDEVTYDLKTQLAANLGAGWSVVHQSPIIYVRKDDGSPFDITITDTLGNTMSLAIKDKVNRFTELPTTGRVGYIVEVTGDESTDYDNYYLKFAIETSATFGEGFWEETVAPGIEYQLDAATLPHELVRLSDGTFEFRQASWGDRIAGDTTTAPWPSFVGRTINDIYFDRKRLCLLADDNAVMSRAGSLFSFFPETVVTVLDDGPIDVSASASKVSILRHAVPFNGTVLLFSDQGQFVVEDTHLLASRPPAIRLLTEHESDVSAPPVGVGKRVFFTAKAGNHTAVHEYYVVPDSSEFDAETTTDQVPRYIPSGVFSFSASPAENALFALSSDEPNRIYVYKYMWKRGQKLQSSWSYWEFGQYATILGAEFIDSKAYVVVSYNDPSVSAAQNGVFLELIDIADGRVDPDAEFVYRIDRRVSEASLSGVVYDAVTDRTTMHLPYAPDAATFRLVTRHGAGSSHPPAVTVDVVSISDNTVVAKGDLTGALLYAGQRYTSTYTFSPVSLKTQNQEAGSIEVMAGRLQVHKWHVAYVNTGYFKAIVSKGSGQDFTYTHTGKKLGTSSAIIGQVSPSDGVHSFRVNSKAGRFSVTLVNDSFLPSAFTGAEWEGRFERRTSRL